MINHNLADVHQPACAQAVHSLTPASSLIQTILSVSESHRIGRRRGSRTIPPVGNFALPRRNHGNYSVFIPINIRICGVIISPVHSITYKREFQYFFNNLSFSFFSSTASPPRHPAYLRLPLCRTDSQAAAPTAKYGFSHP